VLQVMLGAMGGCPPGESWTGAAPAKEENLMAMWVFISLVGFGLAFMLYALVQFFREAKRTNRTHRQGANTKVQGAQSGRLVTMIPIGSRQSREP
jgi:cytosine/uracil/thiamine/allantoin permease